MLAQVGLSSQSSLEDYAKVVLLNNKLPEDSARSADSGEYLYFTYERTANGKDFFYTAVLLKGTDAFWICNFACETSNKKSYSKTFLEWAETIRVD